MHMALHWYPGEVCSAEGRLECLSENVGNASCMAVLFFFPRGGWACLETNGLQLANLPRISSYTIFSCVLNAVFPPKGGNMALHHPLVLLPHL